MKASQPTVTRKFLAKYIGGYTIVLEFAKISYGILVFTFTEAENKPEKGD